MACEDSMLAVSDALALALTGPRKVSGDAGSVEQYSLADLIEADRYVASKCASTRAGRGIRLTKLIPGGTA